MNRFQTQVIHVTHPNTAIEAIRQDGRRVVTFTGFSAAGYEEPRRIEQILRETLQRRDPRSTLVCAGATPDGIGAVYRLAKELGFETIGIVSSTAERDAVRFSDDVDRIFVIEDDIWGGLLDDGVTLSPTSEAMVGSADEFIAIGGGQIAAQEVVEARNRRIAVIYEPADMNHENARAQARHKGQEAPVDFTAVIDRIAKEG